MKEEMIIGLSILMILLIGCESNKCVKIEYTEIDCTAEDKMMGNTYICHYLSFDKCNCCYTNVSMNIEGYYDTKEICFGGDKNETIRTHCI